MAGSLGPQHFLPLDCPLHGDIHGDRSVMNYPFFSLEKTPQTQQVDHSVGGAKITIRSGATGIATMYDKGLILYAASLIWQQIRAGRPVTQEVVFTAHDYFRTTGRRKPSVKDYVQLNEALTRLQGTQVQTDIKTGGEKQRGWFSWIESADAIYSDNKDGIERFKAIRIRLCKFLFRAIERDGQMLSYHHDYFRLGVIERRLYEIARSHCATQGTYEVSLDELRKIVGSRSEMRRFKRNVVTIAEIGSLPEFLIEIAHAPTGGRVRARADETIVRFRPRDASSLSQLKTQGLRAA